jgi:uncharacterized protein YndB with AHSA1/START domain
MRNDSAKNHGWTRSVYPVLLGVILYELTAPLTQLVHSATFSPESKSGTKNPGLFSALRIAMTKKTRKVTHATLVFSRLCAAPVKRVFAAFADPMERERWGTPSENAAFIYDETNFQIGGRDVFRCGPKKNPQFRGVTTYFDIVPNQRIVSSETVETGGSRLFISLATTTFESKGKGTKVNVTVQIVSFAGASMIEGIKDGNNASLDNLVEAVKQKAP